jgi:hypothetical protein
MTRGLGRPVRAGAVGLLGLAMTACASVDLVRTTSEHFRPKASIEEVEVLDQVPKCPHIALAEMSMDDASVSFETMQKKMLGKAAELGADAVVFAKPETQIEHQVAYQSMYSPWGYGGWMYAPYPYGYGYYGGWPGFGAGTMAVPYDVKEKSLRGLAIRYTESGGPKC